MAEVQGGMLTVCVVIGLDWIPGRPARQRRLVEEGSCSGFEPLEEDHEWIGTDYARATRRSVRTQKSREVRKVRLEGVKEREGFVSADTVEVTAEGDGVVRHVMRHVVDQLKARLAVNVRVPAIDANCKSIGDFQMWLGGNHREIEVAVGILHTQFVHPRRRNHRRQSARYRLVANVVVLKRGGQVEAII